MSLALRDALFEDGLDISQPAVLSELAHSLNVGPYDAADNEGVRRDWEDGVRRASGGLRISSAEALTHSVRHSTSQGMRRAH
jgi:hypothetical protein